MRERFLFGANYSRIAARVRLMVITGVLIIGALTALFPIYYTFVTALKTPRAYAISRYKFPSEPTLSNFVLQFERFNVARLITNSVFVTSGGVLLCTVLALMVAYAVTKIRFRGHGFVFAFLVGTLVIPPPTIMVPLYRTVLDIGLMGRYAALILVFAAFGLPLGVYLLSAYFRGIPNDLIDAASIDGAGHWMTLWRIVVPVARPGIAAAGIINSVWMWNDLLLPLLIIPQQSRTTLMVAVASQRNNLEVNIPIISAGLGIAMIPIIVIYLLFQQHLVKGMTAGAVK